ncbi:hypothetical protein [Polaribacter marinivivus]|uniref:Uncharacterized protein n=1 Tax=Polaribacter marinivivus TaxID=1524260 RepID=A0ABV8R4Z1_9FLAO
MIFYHQGSKKKSNELGVASGCLLIIGFGAIIFFFTLLDDIDDLSDYLFEIIGVLVMAISVTYGLFSKKGKIANKHITIKDDYFKIDKVSVLLDTITIDCFMIEGKFSRYFLRDSQGKIAIYSVLNDDLIAFFLENKPQQVTVLEETYHKHEGPYISVKSDDNSLYYDLESGKYTIKKQDEPSVSFTPDVFDYDAKYKLGKPLFKKK